MAERCASVSCCAASGAHEPARARSPMRNLANELMMSPVALPAATEAPGARLTTEPILLELLIVTAFHVATGAVRACHAAAHPVTASIPGGAGCVCRAERICGAGRRMVGRRLDGVPTAIAVFGPTAVGMLVDVAVMPSIDITALSLDRAAAAAGDCILVAAALGAAGGIEASRPAVTVGLALRVHGLVWTGERARAPAAVGIGVLVRRS